MDFWPDRLCCEWKWFSSDFQHLVVWNKFEMALSSISRRETWSVVTATGDRFPLEVRLSGPFWWGPSVMCDMAGQGVWQLVAAVFQGKQWDQRAAGDQMVRSQEWSAGRALRRPGPGPVTINTRETGIRTQGGARGDQTPAAGLRSRRLGHCCQKYHRGQGIDSVTSDVSDTGRAGVLGVCAIVWVRAKESIE